MASGPGVDAALAKAPDALSAVVEVDLPRSRPLPEPRPAMTRAALAQRMGQDERVARRIVYGSGARLELTIAARRAVGVRVVLVNPDAVRP